MQTKLKIFILTLLMTVLFVQPTYASSGFQSSQGAVVGKVICQSDITEQYIIYGRLSMATSDGYRVYQTGKFFYVQPTDSDSKLYLQQRIGQGVKAFGTLELLKGSSEILYSNTMTDYNPKDDYGVMEPAYGEAGPHKWIGFGVALDQYRANTTKLAKSTDVINTLADFADILPRTICTVNNETYFYDPATKKKFELNEAVSALTGTKTAFTPDNPAFLAPIRNFWQANFKQSYLIEQSQKAYAQMTRAHGGFVYITGLSGRANNLMQSVPAIRPDMDKFMDLTESQCPVEFTDWASPAVFYGRISGTPNNESHLLTTPRPPQILEDEEIEFITPTYTGPYYPEDKPESLIKAIEANQAVSESWPIGWQGQGTLYPGFTPHQYAQYEGQYVWMTGTRVLVYEIITCTTNKDGEVECSTSINHVQYGNMKEGTFSHGNSTTTVTLVGYYINPDHIITKQQYNYLLNLIRELVLKGGS